LILFIKTSGVPCSFSKCLYHRSGS